MDFKKYLDSKGSELSKANEFLAYYALPYIPNPWNHPSFKHLFTVEWVQDLKQKLKGFISQNSEKLGLKSPAQSSKLYGIYRDFNKYVNEQPEGMANETFSDRMKQMHKTMMILQKKESYSKRMLYESQLKWTNFSSDVVRNCKELIMVLEQQGIRQYQLYLDNTGQGTVRNLDNIKIKIHKYDLFLKNNTKELSAKGYGNSASSPAPQRFEQQQEAYHHPLTVP